MQNYIYVGNFLCYLNVLYVFRYFVWCQAALAFCKCCCREATKIHEQLCQYPLKSFPKSIQRNTQHHKKNNQKEAPKIIPKTTQNGCQADAKLIIFG